MAYVFRKTKPSLVKSKFFDLAEKVSEFSSSTGKRYKLKSVLNGKMLFHRLDGVSDIEFNYRSRK